MFNGLGLCVVKGALKVSLKTNGQTCVVLFESSSVG